MSKPIAVMYLPNDYYYGPHWSVGVLNAMFNGIDNKVQMPSGFADYLWFVFVDQALHAPRLEVFHEKNFTNIQYEELRQLIEKNLNELKTATP